MATATGSGKSEKTSDYKLASLSVRMVDWYDTILTGIYDENFKSSVDDLLKSRDSLKIMDTNTQEEMNIKMQMIKDNDNFKNCIHKKMRECCLKPRGVLDYIKSNISWNSNKKCISCPDKSCLIYIHEIYYSFLLDNSIDLSVIDKLYILILCEARICILSKCLCLEAIRCQDNNIEVVQDLLRKNILKDKKMKNIYASAPEISVKYQGNIKNKTEEVLNHQMKNI